ncbi:MAG: valine--tRNA ligase [Candidatus Jordarchaeales archaeon]|nr:valine--tRNA ligase [Candidatus Jordarchaeia archaeon]
MSGGKIKEPRWDVSKESEIWELWQKEKTYRFNENSGKPFFTIDNPPPYVSGRWHMGGAVHYASIDFIARFMRMKGFEVLYKFGLDRNGLPVEVSVEKEYKIKMTETPREVFIAKCKEYLDRVGNDILNICKLMGFSNNSFEWDEIYKTDQDEYRALTQATFIELWRKGYIYEDERPVSWCSDCQTVIAEAEIERQEEETSLYYIKFKVKETGEDLVIATTRPELICACGAVIVNPDDDRYTRLHGLTAVTPIYGKEVPIIPHPAAKPEYGTGVVMVCSYGDMVDLRLFRELSLTPTFAINKDGLMTKVAGKYAGLSVKNARSAIVEDLKRMGLLVKSEKIVHSQPICWRSKTPIEYVAMKEYYLKMLDFVPQLREIAEKVEWHPPSAKYLWLNWINSLTMDWPISRRRYYGTEIPIWYCKKCGAPNLPEPGKYYKPWMEQPPFNKCAKCGGSDGFIGETRTFDTWVDSSISPLFISLYPGNVKESNESFFKKLSSRPYLCDLRPQGKDIVGTWLNYTMLRILQILDKPAFKHVWISGHVVDKDGRKMSKSLGNIVYPEPVVAKYGADAVRLYASMIASLGDDVRFDESKVAGVARFLQKLWNIARFISNFPEPTEVFSLTETDKWILSELNKLIRKVDESYSSFDFHPGTVALYNFTWNVFASHYVEMVKARAYNRNGTFSESEQKAAHWTLHFCLKTILKLLAPVTPFITDAIWRQLYSRESIHKEKFPEADPSMILEEDYTPLILETNSVLWKVKKNAGLSLKVPLKAVILPKKLEAFAMDLREMHNIEELQFSDEPKGNGFEEFQADGKRILVAVN